MENQFSMDKAGREGGTQLFEVFRRDIVFSGNDSGVACDGPTSSDWDYVEGEIGRALTAAERRAFETTYVGQFERLARRTRG